MRDLVILNNAILLLCTSMYLGTGWSLILFSFPIAPSLTVDNYYMQFVPQVKAATRFFTYMTMVMIATAIILLVVEWGKPLMWVPITVLAAVVAATGLTVKFIIPYNKQMEAGIKDQALLNQTLSKWMGLNRLRVALWTVQWLATASWFTVQAS